MRKEANKMETGEKENEKESKKESERDLRERLSR